MNYDLWCDSLGSYRKKDIMPFIMIHNKQYEWLSISIDYSPKVISGNSAHFIGYEQILDYIAHNEGILLRHWYGVIDDLELINNVKEKQNYDICNV